MKNSLSPYHFNPTVILTQFSFSFLACISKFIEGSTPYLPFISQSTILWLPHDMKSESSQNINAIYTDDKNLEITKIRMKQKTWYPQYSWIGSIGYVFNTFFFYLTFSFLSFSLCILIS